MRKMQRIDDDDDDDNRDLYLKIRYKLNLVLIAGVEENTTASLQRSRNSLSNECPGNLMVRL